MSLSQHADLFLRFVLSDAGANDKEIDQGLHFGFLKHVCYVFFLWSQSTRTGFTIKQENSPLPPKKKGSDSWIPRLPPPATAVSVKCSLNWASAKVLETSSLANRSKLGSILPCKEGIVVADPEICARLIGFQKLALRKKEWKDIMHKLQENITSPLFGCTRLWDVSPMKAASTRTSKTTKLSWLSGFLPTK